MIARTLTLLLAIQVAQAVHMRSLIQVVNWSSKTTNMTANATATIDSQKKANATTSAQVAANLTKAANGTANVTSNATSYAAIRAKANAIANVSINANASSGKNASSNSTKNTKAFAATNASSKATVNATANMTSKVSANATTKATVNATANATTGQKTMLQLWDKARATSLETKIGVIDEKISQCYIQAASNKSMNYTRNSTTNDYPQMATLCKAEKSELMAVHGEVTKELLNYIELIKSGSDTFNQRNIEANGLKPSQMEPFTLATKLVQVLEQSETRHLGRSKPEAAFEKLTEEMSNILEWYEKHEKISNVKVQED